MTAPTPAPAPSPSGKGPIGEARNPTTVFWLTLVTCGIYGWFWAYKTFEELKQHNGEGLGGVVGMILSWFWVGYFMLPMEVQKTYQDDGKQSPVEPILGLWLLLPIVGYYIYLQKVQGALNEYWVSKGAVAAA